ncbi:MAG: leucine-rich repeat protein [Prevotellaceae bacterium]|jgi:hypothetical protein|nr:leucine-rich repeat protein [Prevotellaceae bacterium]
MKKYFALISTMMILCIVGCNKEYDDTKVWNSIHSLEERISAMETVMNAYKNNLFITSVTTITDGYVITFSDGSKATIMNGEDGVDGKDGENGKDGVDGKDGLDGVDGDTYIQSITIGENEVTFVLTDGQRFSISLYSMLTIAFEADDLVVMSANSSRNIRYTVNSILTDVKVEVISSADLKAKAIPDDASNLTGAIHVTTGAAIDEYSKVVVFVSNGEKVVMKSFTFEETGVQIADNATKEATAEGGEVILEFLSNVACQAVIPEAAQSWISVVPATRALEYNAITLKLEPNTGYYRSAVVKVQGIDGSIAVEYTIEQDGDLGTIDAEAVPADEIWYVMSDGSVYDVYQTTNIYGHQPFDRTIISNTYKNGKGVIKFDGAVTRINDHTFGNFWASNMIGLYLPDNIEYIGTGGISNTGLTTLRIPANLKTVDSYGLNNPNMESFTGSHVSEDGKCVIIDKTMYAFAPKGIKEYTVPTGVETVSWNVLSWCNELESLTFPEGVVSVYGDAVCECPSLKSVTLPSTLENLATYAFRGCLNIEGFYGNEKYHTPDNKCLISYQDYYWGGNVLCGFAGKGITEYVLPEGIVGIENYGLQSGKDLRSLTLPSTLVEVGGVAFEGCSNLEAVYGPNTSEDHRCVVFGTQLRSLAARKGMPANYSIPDNITSIGYMAFSHCSEIESITMGDQVTELGGYDFYDCPNLKSVTLSAGIKRINSYNPFLDSSNLESIYCRAVMPPSYNDTQMREYPNLKFYVPEQSLELYKNHPSWGLFAKYMVGYKYDDLPEIDYYISSDFSQNGKVTTLQTATKGNGIDIVLMGDGYSDRQIAAGTYDNTMTLAAEKLFTEEPYKSFRDYFNVYAVTAVSMTEGYEHGNTAFGGFFGGGTYVGGNDETVFTYAQKAISEDRMDEALLVVMMNSDAYAGTCYMYYPSAGDYGNGISVAYFPVGTDETSLEQLMHHEANGHGFSKLADEYAYEDMGEIPALAIENNKQQEPYGWWKNVDFTSDPTTIKWSHFLSDERYANDGLGAYEGGFTYWTGVWRPTENSIMRYNTGGFNAPSREAIYYRIHKLAYGESWTYNYEDFVAYDAINRKTSTSSGAFRFEIPKNYKPLHPPVVKKMSWRDANKGR